MFEVINIQAVQVTRSPAESEHYCQLFACSKSDLQFKTTPVVPPGRPGPNVPPGHSDMFLFFSPEDERAAAELACIAGQFTDEEEHPENSSSSKGEDLLAMMDELRPTAEPNHQNQT